MVGAALADTDIADYPICPHLIAEALARRISTTTKGDMYVSSRSMPHLPQDHLVRLRKPHRSGPSQRARRPVVRRP